MPAAKALYHKYHSGMIVADERKTRAGAVVSKASKRRRDEAANRTGDDAIDSSGTLDSTGVLSLRPSTDEINKMMGVAHARYSLLTVHLLQLTAWVSTKNPLNYPTLSPQLMR